MELFTQILLGVLLSGMVAMNLGCLRTGSKFGERITSVETKIDIYLDSQGFDIRKVNRAIKDHKDELKKNNRPSVGCINVKDLYKDKEE